MKIRTDKRMSKWAAAVKLQNDEKCEWCGQPEVDPCHIIPRKFVRTRYLLQNGLSFCRNHHNEFDRDIKFRKKILNLLVGREKYENLKSIRDDRNNPEDFGYEEIK